MTKLLRYSRQLLATGAFIVEVRQEACAPALPVGVVGPGFGPGILGVPGGVPGAPGVPWRARSTDATDGYLEHVLIAFPLAHSGSVVQHNRVAVNCVDRRSPHKVNTRFLCRSLDSPSWRSSATSGRTTSKRADLVRFPDQAESAGSAASAVVQRQGLGQGPGQEGPGEVRQDAVPQDHAPEHVAEDAGPEAQRGAVSAALGLPPLLAVCGAPSYKDWLAGASAWASTVPSALVQCPVGVFPFAKCREMRGLAGVFTSPRYPEPYPNNARVCYR